ncbi:MAG: ABC transporter ATP-binding protein [Bacteroidia bacterium]
MLNIKGLHKKFGKVKVLEDVDLGLPSKGIAAILGPNGSGKTTLIKSILGLTIPDRGDILLNDKRINGNWEYRKRINYLPQIANFPPNLRVDELIAMIKDLRQMPAFDHELIEKFALEPFLDKKLGNLSGGTKQKVNIVICFMFDSPMIILDEPTTGLDPKSLLHLKELINREKEKGKLIIITSHIMSFVEEVANDIVFLLDGKIRFQGSTEQIMKDQQKDKLEEAVASILE